MIISYHAWKEYGECPKKYFLKYRKKAPFTIPKNDYFTLYGKLVERFFQHFCNTWRFTMPYMPPEEIKFKLTALYRIVLNTSTVDWTVPYATLSEEEIFNQAYGDVCAIMNSQNQNYFLNTKSEIALEVAVQNGARLTCRLDFVHKKALSDDLNIFDGKGSTEIGKNVEDDQVLFYALMYYFHYKRLAEEIGFFYYRYNTFKPIPISLSILNEFRAKLSLRVKNMMEDSTFAATPSAKACKYCEYRLNCIEGIESKAKRKRPSRLDIVEDPMGITEIGF